MINLPILMIIAIAILVFILGYKIGYDNACIAKMKEFTEIVINMKAK